MECDSNVLYYSETLCNELANQKNILLDYVYDFLGCEI